MPRRVLIFHSQADGYGSDRALRDLAVGLRRRGWEVDVAVPGEGPFVRDLRSAGIVVHEIDPGVLRRVYGLRDWARFLVWGLPRAIVRAWRLSRRADIVHINTSVIVGALIGAALARRPVVLHVRESYADNGRSFHAYARAVARMVSSVVAVSSAIRDDLHSTALGSKAEVIVDGIEFDPVLRRVREPGSTVLCVGRINEWKGQGVLIAAVALLRDSGVEADLLLAGDVFPGGEHFRRRLEQQIVDLELEDRVRLLGFVDDVGSVLAQADVFVLPSTRPEPFGLALVEAMAAGLACVATNQGGPKEIVVDGQTGVLVPPDDPQRLADVLGGLLASTERRAQLGRAAMVDVRTRFGVENTVTAVEAVYLRLLDPTHCGVAP